MEISTIILDIIYGSIMQDLIGNGLDQNGGESEELEVGELGTMLTLDLFTQENSGVTSPP